MSTNLKTRSPNSLPVEFTEELSTPTPPKGIYNAAGEPLCLGSKIGTGGEGAVYEIADHPTLVAKLYHELPAPEKAEKLIALANLGAEALYKIAAWPVDVLRDSPGGNVIGFVMHKITQAEEVHALHSPKSRLQKFPDASWSFLIHVATNIARAVAALHERGFVIGDVNPKNILVTKKATVYLLDCDSFQFAADNKIYRCEGGFPEYTPPELQGLAFADVNRNQEHDCFGLAVVLFQLLFLGRHPFSGRFLGAGEMSLERAIREGRFAYGTEATTRQMQPPPGTLPLDAIPDSVTELLHRAFLSTTRPQAREWIAPLTNLATSLQRCALHSGHYYHEALTACPWCQIETRARIRLFNFNLAEAKQHRSAFRLDEIWDEVQKLQTLEPPGQKVTLLPQISEEVMEYAQQRRRRFWFAVVYAALGGGLIAWVIGVCAIFWLLPIFWVTAIRIAEAKKRRSGNTLQSLFPATPDLPNHPLAHRFLALQKNTENDLRQLEQKLVSAKEKETFLTKVNELESRLESYETLTQRRAHQLKKLEAKARATSRQQYLKQFDIQEAGLSLESTAELRARGIANAADLSAKQLKHLSATGAVQLAERLQHWQRSKERDWTFDPLRDISKESRTQIEQTFDHRALQLEYEITSSAHHLRHLRQRIDAQQQQVLPALAQAQQILAETEKNLEVLRWQNPSLPITLAMVGGFLVTIVLTWNDWALIYHWLFDKPSFYID